MAKAVLVSTVDIPHPNDCHDYLLASGWILKSVGERYRQYEKADEGKERKHHTSLPFEPKDFTTTVFENFIRGLAWMEHTSETRIYCRIQGLPNI